VNRVLAGGIGVVDLNRAIGQKAGALLHRIGLDSRHAVDAFVVATARCSARGHRDARPDDLQRLAAREPGVTILRV